MNWTEGALARHSRGRGWKPELAKQRQYFAKARAGLRGASGPNIASISILPRQPESPTVHPGKLPPRTLTQSSPRFQPQQSPHSETGGCNVGHSPRQRPQEEESPVASRSFPKLHESMHTSAKRNQTVDDEEALDVKRRRLLQKSDWAGINVAKSIPFHFSARNNLAGNQIWGFGKKYTTGQPAPFFQQIRHNKNALRGSATSHSSTQDGDREFRIKIGSEDIRLGSEVTNTARNTHKRSLRTIPRSKKYHRSGYFQHSLSQTLPQHHTSPENHDHGEVVSHRTRHLRGIPLERVGAAPEDATMPVSSSTSHSRQTRLERVQRAGQPLVFESSPSVAHPVPQRFSQLVLAETLGTPKSDVFGSTIAEVSHNPLAAVPSSEISENERWHGMFASSGDREETPDNIVYNRITIAEDISPGASNFPVPGCPPTHLSSPEYPHISSLSNRQETPTDRKVMQVDLLRYHHGSSDENDDGRYLPEDTVSATRLSSSLSPTNISLSSEKLAASDRKGHASHIQGMTRMAEEVLVENLFDTVTRSPSSSMALDSPGERIADQHELDVCTSGNTKRLKNKSLVLQPPGIGAGRSTSAPEPTPIGADAEWINFIFGDDGDEVQETALQEARKEAARHLRPSSSSANSYCQNLGSPSIDHGTAATATYGTFNGGSERNGITLSPHSRCSSGFGPDLTDMGALRNSTDASLETYNHVDTHGDIAGSTIVEVAESITQGMQSVYPITDISSTPALDSISTVAQPPESEVGEVPGPSFQFARPKTFIGRLASSLVQDAGPIVPLSVHNEPNKSGRPKRRSRKKKAKDGRADIRRVPDHDGDPIDGGSDE